MCIKRVSILLAVVLVIACGKQEVGVTKIDPQFNGASSNPLKDKQDGVVIETNSPDNAVKSWWTLVDLIEVENKARCEELEKMPKPGYLSLLDKVASGDTLKVHASAKLFCSQDKYEREIQEVKAESETRALVFARIRNVTPPPAGAEVDQINEKWRKEGFRFKYLTEKTAAGWRVVQVYKYDKVNLDLGRDAWEVSYKFDDNHKYFFYVYKP